MPGSETSENMNANNREHQENDDSLEGLFTDPPNGPTVQREVPSTNELMMMMMEENWRRDMLLMEITNKLATVMSSSSASGPSTATFQVMPDLNKEIKSFNGEDVSEATEWLANLESMRLLHHWPDSCTLEMARMHLTDGARFWYIGRRNEMSTWNEFKVAFKNTFIGQASTTVKWQRMIERTQAKGEKIHSYFHEKVKLCRELNLDFDGIREQVLVGIESRELCAMVSARQHFDIDEVLHDINQSSRIIEGRQERTKMQYKKTAERRPVTKAPARKKFERPAYGRNSNVPVPIQEVKCFNCSGVGHYSSNCPEPKRSNRSCFNCGSSDHQIRNCPQRNGISASNSVNTATEVKKYIPCIDVRVEGLDSVALIDSGSSTNIIRENLANKLNLKISKDNKIYTGLGRINVQSLGCVSADVSINNDSYKMQFTVMPNYSTTREIILGEPFFNDAVVTFGPQGMTVTKSKIVEEPIAQEEFEILQISVEQNSPTYVCNPNITNVQRVQLDQLLGEYTENLQEAVPTEDMAMKIEVTCDKPIIHRPRRLGQKEQQQVRELLDELQRRQVIRPSRSEYCSPIVLCKKKW